MNLDFTAKEKESITYRFVEVEPPQKKGQAVKIYAMSEDEIIAEYMREFTKPVNQVHYWNFVGKFIEDMEYRNTFKILN